jgi:hypothetical protein
MNRKPGFSGKMFWTLEIPFTGFTVSWLDLETSSQIPGVQSAGWLDIHFTVELPTKELRHLQRKMPLRLTRLLSTWCRPAAFFLGKWRSSFAGSSDGKMNVQSACALNILYNHQQTKPLSIKEDMNEYIQAHSIWLRNIVQFRSRYQFRDKKGLVQLTTKSFHLSLMLDLTVPYDMMHCQSPKLI